MGFLLKSILYSVGIVGGGILCLKVLQPSSAEIEKTLKENGRQSYQNTRNVELMLKMIQDNASSNNAAWDVQYPSSTPAKTETHYKN
jgi:hypothetical protein